MRLIKEFREFAIKGNVVDLATAVIVGGAFGKIVSSLVADVIMPLTGLLTGANNFSNWKIILRPEIKNAGGDIVKTALSLNAGLFLQNILDFLIIASAVFLMIKFLLKIKNKFNNETPEKEPTTEPEPSIDVKLLTEIRDLLKEKNI